MIITIFNASGHEKVKVSPNDSSTQSQEIQGDNVLSLSFTLHECVPLDVNDYVVFQGNSYVMMESYYPEQVSTMEWNYSVNFYGMESLIKRFLVLNTTDGDAEAVFTLTGPATQHLELITRCINEGLGVENAWRVGRVESTGNIVITYEGKYCDEALKELAEQAGTEWWVEGNSINLSRCEHSEELTLGYMEGLISLEKQQDNQAKFFTRLFPIGSSRNIDPSVYGHSRLVLPGGKKYVDVEELVKLYGIVHHYEKNAFSHIYPRRIGTLSAVRHEEAQGEDGKAFSIYYFKDSGLNFDPNEYQLAGQVLRVSFQEGSELYGLGTDDEHFFEVNYHSDTKEFEVITIWPYDDGTPLPGGLLAPKVGDTYILWNLRMPDEYYTLAEQEFEDAVREYNVKHGIDTAIYKASTDHVWFEANQIDLQVGQRVRLNSREFFPQAGFRNSRVTKITRKVNYPTIMELEISDALSVGTMQKINDNITSVKNYTRQLSVSVPDIIRSWEDIPATENNVLSSKRSYKEFLSKTSEDVAQKLITFLEGVLIGNEGYRLRPNGDAVLGKITSLVYDAVTQQGFGIEKGKNGYKLSITDIEVWGKAIFNNLELRKLSYVGGNYSFSPAGSKIVYVKWIDAQGNITTDINQTSAFRCYMATDDGTTTTRNLWEVGDQARCQEFDIKEGNHHGTSNRNYWRLVVGKSSEAEELTDIMGTPIYTDKKFEWIDLSKSDASAPTDDFPKAGDTIVARGNRTNPLRQGFIDINTHGENAPSIVVYSGVNSYQLNDGNVTALLSPRDIRLSAEKLKMLSSDGRFSSFLEMTRNEISLSLRDFGGTNMLHGSSFMGELPPLNSFSQPFACNRTVLGDDDAKKHLGRNYMKIEESGNSEPVFSGLFHHVNVEPGETYTASVWLMSENNASIDGTGFTIEVLKMANGERVKPNALIGYHYTTPKENGIWERAVYTFVVPDDIKEIGVNFWLPRNGHIYVSEPQLERGTIATDWSEHPDDIKHQVQKAGINIKEGTLNLSGENIIISNSGNSEPTALFKDGKIKSSYIESTVLTTVPDERGCYTEIYENVFHLHGAKGKNGIKQYIDKDGMPHLVFYTPDGLPAFDMWWGNMVSLFPGLIQAHWEECFLMSVQGQNGLYVVQNKNADYKVYEYHASYNTSSKKYGEDGHYDMMLFVEKDVNSPTIPDGWYIKKTVYGWYSEVPIQPSISTIKWVGAVTLISVQNGKLQKINNKDYIIQYFDFDNGYMIDGKLGYMGKTFGDGIIK